jgi:hypothetical protein
LVPVIDVNKTNGIEGIWVSYKHELNSIKPDLVVAMGARGVNGSKTQTPNSSSPLPLWERLASPTGRREAPPDDKLREDG